MLPMKTILKRIRTRIHDVDEIVYDDEEILDVINCGIRFIRRAITEIRPSLLISTVEGTLSAGEKSFELEDLPTKIVHVTAGDRIIKTVGAKKFYSEKALHQTELAQVIVKGNDVTGTPTDFYLTGLKTINFFPIPEVETKYTVLYVKDFEELGLNDKSPINTEYDDFLIEYGTIRLGMRDEFDVSQENQVMANIFSQIQQLLLPPPLGVQVQSYS